MDAVSKAQSQGWQKDAEVGAAVGIRALLVALRVFGRPFVKGILGLVSFYYVLFYPRVRRHSRTYLRRLGVPSGFWSNFRHVWTFAVCSLDRFFFIRDAERRFRFKRHGLEELRALHVEGKGGAVLFGAHLGSFEALRAGSRESGANVNVVMDTRNAQRVRKFLEAVGGERQPGILEVDDGAIELMIKARDCVEQGEVVAILADRVGAGQRFVTVPFLGAPMRVPIGPFLMASRLRCPVFLTFGLYLGGNRYELHGELFADAVDLPRKGRQEALLAYATKYAERLEHYCRLAPYNWFNFFDFWEEEGP